MPFITIPNYKIPKLKKGSYCIVCGLDRKEIKKEKSKCYIYGQPRNQPHSYVGGSIRAARVVANGKVGDFNGFTNVVIHVVKERWK